MSHPSSLWPARLHHLQLESPNPESLAAFYREALGMSADRLTDGSWLLRGGERRLVIAEGPARTLGFAAYAVNDSHQLDRLRSHLRGNGASLERSPTRLFDDRALGIRDPDGTLLVLGVPLEAAAGRDHLPGRLQHVVVTSKDASALARFYESVLGFLVSDRVVDEAGSLTACFLRSDSEHHSFAVFRASECRLDHHSYETSGWNDLRDWVDHFASLGTEIWWGPGRHGPGNDLFFMIRDSDGNNLEFSADLEQRPVDVPPGQWRHEPRTLNRWGQAFLRR